MHRHAVHFDERSLAVAQRQERPAHADFDRVAEGGATDELQAGARQQAHFAQTGETRHTVRQLRDDGPRAGLEFRKSRAFHARSGVGDHDGLRHAVAKADFRALNLSDDGPAGADDAHFRLLPESHLAKTAAVAGFSEHMPHNHSLAPLRSGKRLTDAVIVIAGG